MRTDREKVIHWKGWVIPGPPVASGPGVPPASSLALGNEELTLDALSGHFRIYQYKNGHRYSTDDVLVAWYGTTHCPAVTRALDLGSGIGSVAMIAAWRLSGVPFVTIEAQEISVALARKSIEHNGLENRFTVLHGDFREHPIAGNFDLILSSPPYFPLEDGTLGNHEQKIACRFEVRGDLHDYCQVAARHLSPGGVFASIFPVQPLHQEERITPAVEAAGLSVVRQRDVALKEGEPPMLRLLLMARKADLPERFRNQTWVDPVLTIRQKDGSVHPEYSVIKMSIGFPP